MGLADLLTTLRLGRDRLRARRDTGGGARPDSGAVTPPSVHDLMPLDLATAVVFRRVYCDERQAPNPAPLSAQLDGLAYTIAELAPIYVYERTGHSLRLLSREELEGGLFRNGAKVLTYIDGRAPIRDLAISAKKVSAVIQALSASSEFGQAR
jgi:hypothetical protein